MIYIMKPTDYSLLESQRLKSINIIAIFRSYQYLLNLPLGENIWFMMAPISLRTIYAANGQGRLAEIAVS